MRPNIRLSKDHVPQIFDTNMIPSVLHYVWNVKTAVVHTDILYGCALKKFFFFFIGSVKGKIKKVFSDV